MTSAEISEFKEELMEEKKQEAIAEAKHQELLMTDEEYAIEYVVTKYGLAEGIRKAVQELNDIGWSYDGKSLLHEISYMI